jgi:hypothetical protein
LFLDAEDREAAEALVRLFDHVCPSNRRGAVWAAAEALEHHKGLRTGPLRDLRARLSALVDTADDDVFCVLAPALWDVDARVSARMSRLLKSRSVAKQQSSVSALEKVQFSAWPLLIKWASRPRDPVLVLTTLGPHLRLLPDARRAEIAVAGLAHTSPWIRHEAASVLGSLDETVAAKHARAAMKDEPEPIIRKKLLRLVPRRRKR